MSETFFTTRRFLPLFVTQFLGAFNDNLFKNSLVMLITFRLAAATGENAQVLVTLAAGLFVLPYFLFSATAGQLADAFDRARLSRHVKLAEIILALLGAYGLVAGSSYFLLGVLFLLGTQATFFGPIKYALLPQHLAHSDLIAGNGYIEGGTFLAILLGTILGGVLILLPGGVYMVSAGMLAIALVGYIASLQIPPAPAPEPGMKIGLNLPRETWRILGYGREHPRVWRCIIGISWFWLVGATFLAQFPTLAKDTLHADHTVVTLFLTLFSVGIGVGSVLVNRLLRGDVQSTHVPAAALAMTVFMVDMYFASDFIAAQHAEFPPANLLNYHEFLAQPGSIRLVMDLFFMSVCGGVFIVPLYALMQHLSRVQHRARVIAANNIMNALFMVASAVMTLLMLKLHFTIPQVFLTIALLNAGVAIYICALLPDAVLRTLVKSALGVLFRVRVRGVEHFPKDAERLLVVANHTSFLDALLLAAYVPTRVTFAINTHIARRWWVRPLLKLVEAHPIDPTNPLAAKTMVELLRAGKTCVIFPEGRITVTGGLMKVYDGPGMIADKADAVILPIRIDGAQYSYFSRMKGMVRLRLLPRVTLTFLPPEKITVDTALKGRKRRQAAGAKLYDMMSNMMFESSDRHVTLFDSLAEAVHLHGRDHVIAEDIERAPVSYGAFLTRVMALKILLRPYLTPPLPNPPPQGGREQVIGLLLPNSVGHAVTFFAVQAMRKTAAMLNFTAGPAGIASACHIAAVQTVLTSQRFVEMGKLEPIIAALKEKNIRVVYLEELRANVTPWVKLRAALASHFPLQNRTKTDAADTAVILFTSGSEGTPKGVALSHKNIQANRQQIAARLDFGPRDRVFNCLPMFHAFGLTGGTLLPMLSGIRTFFYPTPLHYRIIPELLYDTNCTVLFGTDTFLAGYAKYAHPYDMRSLRFVVAGAEKLRDETRKNWAEKFGLRVIEGYGATECAPVISANTPMQYRAGSVGRIMPGIAHRLEPVPGITQGGQLHVRGPNIMQGYYKADQPGVLQPLADGWYDTGDIVSLDADGFVTIQGRVKRFAKIGGEMVSLTAVELAVQTFAPDHQHAAVSIPDEKKGEQIVLMTTHVSLSRDMLTEHFRRSGLTELALPRRVMGMEKLPLLSTGKIDYITARALAMG